MHFVARSIGVQSIAHDRQSKLDLISARICNALHVGFIVALTYFHCPVQFIGQLFTFGTPSRWGRSLSFAAACYGLDLARLPRFPSVASTFLQRCGCPKELQDLILRMTAINPEDRPSARELLQDAYFDAMRPQLEGHREWLRATNRPT